MLKWIGKVLGGSPEESSGAGSNAWVKRLETLLAPLDKLPKGQGRSGLARDMLEYVVRGDSFAVLAELGQRTAVGEHLHVTGYHYGRHGGTRPSIYRDLGEVQPGMLLRWAQLLQACAAGQSQAYKIQMPDGSHWQEALLMHAADVSVTGWSSQRAVAKGIDAELMEAMLVEAGLQPAALLVASFATPVSSGYGVEQRLLLVTDLDGYREYVARHVDEVRLLLLMASVPQRLHALNMLEKLDAQLLSRLSPELCELAASSSKQVRAAAEPLIRRCAADVIAPLKAISSAGKPEQRVNALRLLWAIANQQGDEALRGFAREAAQADKAPTAQALVEEWTATKQAAEETEETRYDYSVPEIDWSGALTPVVSAHLDKLWSEMNQSVERSNKQMRDHNEQMRAKGHKYPLRQDPLYSEESLKLLKRYIASPDPKWEHQPRDRRSGWQHSSPAIQKLATLEGITPVVLFKILCFLGIAADKNGQLEGPAALAFSAMHKSNERPALLELSQMLVAIGLPSSGLLHSYCKSWSPIAADWKPASVWPYFAHHLDLLASTLVQAPKDYYFDRSALFRAVASLPIPPPTVINALFDLALGTAKSDRLAAQDALAGHIGKEARIINALADGKSETRAVAAHWLGRLRHAPAVPALEQAVLKEKHDVPKGAMLDTLQLLDQPVEKYLDRDKLAIEAAKSVGKGLPKDIEWFPWNAMPEVRWADSGTGVSNDMLRWILVQAVKQKSPEPNAVLRKFCAMFEPRDRERLGQFVLETWLREDVRPIPPDEAMRRATSQAQSTHGFMKQYPQHYKEDPNFGKSVEELTAQYLPGFLRQPQGSAIGSKGLLAVAAACAAERAADPVGRYLKEYYGTRAAQGKALIGMLAWIDHPSSTQLMLSIGSRFRTKSFQEEATRQAEALADRNNWTLSELADRTMPTAGFDETGTLELSYGQRVFSARLQDDFKVELFNPDGRKIAALPEPRQDDDAELAKDAKKGLAAAKKSIKSIIDLQSDRLYEALCTERDWSYADWDLYLNRHPIVRRLLQRLVWVRLEDGKFAGAFRPMDDGTLTDQHDNEVKPSPQDRVRLAHDSRLPGEDVRQWQQHLVDYQVVPLFQQLGKGTYALPESKVGDNSIKDFEGHLLEAFALRGRALKLGYTRGAAEDGGWFHVYEKRFPTLGLVAVIEFTGNPLPESNRTVALLNLSFSSNGDTSWQRGQLLLSKVPKVLLSECYNDLRLIAAEGSGYDKDWEKKSEY